ncbi:hypothetical protein J1605_022530 [Eschrichtius robustus]|uniref:Uncharacterized protein n=1 Tax=Eschrichtius robustus TaxID=9764 RepID=A0AB34H915_ESCRO|nr:hypothetical protein J1605_022530 [Eschrichtius robustus]
MTRFSPTSSETGYLVHALQTTLWTFSRLFKSPPGERGKKNPEEIRVNWKEKFSKGCPQRRKSPDSADLQTTTRLSGGSGETASHTDLTRNPAPPGHIPPLSGIENSSLRPEAPFPVLGKHSGR